MFFKAIDVQVLGQMKQPNTQLEVTNEIPKEQSFFPKTKTSKGSLVKNGIMTGNVSWGVVRLVWTVC